jgi:hypothetical protein
MELWMVNYFKRNIALTKAINSLLIFSLLILFSLIASADSLALPAESLMRGYVTIDGENLQEMTLNDDGTASFNIDNIKVSEHTLKFQFIVTDNGNEYTIASFERSVTIDEGTNDLTDLIGEAIDIDDYGFPDEDNDGKSNFEEINNGENSSTPNWTVGGEITELNSEQLEISLNSGATLTTTDDNFIFPTRITHLESYTVELVKSPVGFD